MKNTLSLLLIVISLFLFPSCGSNLSKKKTDAHRLIPGTNLFIIPPFKFEPAQTYAGFQHEQTYVSISCQTKNKSLEEFLVPYSKEGRKINKVLIEEKKDISYDDYKGVFLITKNYGERKYEIILAIDFGRQLMLLKSNNLKERLYPVFGESIRESILSVVIDTEAGLEINTDVIPFTLYSVDETDFKIAHKGFGGFTYTKDGNFPTLSLDESLVRISFQSDFRNQFDALDYTDKYAKELLGGNDISVEHNQWMSQDGLDGYEVLAYLMDEGGNKVKMSYRVVLLYRGGVFDISGVFKDDFEMNLVKMKAFVHSWRQPKFKVTF